MIFQKTEVSYSEKLQCKPDLDNGCAYWSETNKQKKIALKPVCLASTGSPAELSPSTLSPVNHSLGKLEILKIISPCVVTLHYICNYFKSESAL